MRKSNFLLPLLEDFSPEKIDVVSSDNKMLEGIKGAFGSPGGKFFVAGKLVAMFPEHKRYVEPFIGGASILFRKNKEAQEFINDKDEEIVFCYRFIQNLSDAQLESLKSMEWKTTKETFDKLLKEYKESPAHNDPTYRFYRIVYLKQTSDAGEMRSFDDRAEEAGEVIKVTDRLMNIKERLQGVTIENMDYKDFVKKYSNEESFTFLDPPYPSARMNWKWCPTQEEFESFTKTVPGKWMVTYEVCDGWKESKYYRKILSQYNISAPAAGHMSRKSELVVTNYPIKQNTSYLSNSCMDDGDLADALDFISGADLLRLSESQDLERELKGILKLYAGKRRGEEIKQSFEQLRQMFKKCVKKCIETNIADFRPEKLSPYALELFDRYTEYKYVVAQPDGSTQDFPTLKALKDSNIDYRGYKFEIKMKEAEKQIGNFALYHQWWKEKDSSRKVESYIVSTDLGIDLFFDNPVNADLKEAVFYIRPGKAALFTIRESVHFFAPNSENNASAMPSWLKVLESGKISILESSETEKIIEFSGENLKGMFTAKRESESSDFWMLKK